MQYHPQKNILLKKRHIAIIELFIKTMCVNFKRSFAISHAPAAVLCLGLKSNWRAWRKIYSYLLLLIKKCFPDQRSVGNEYREKSSNARCFPSKSHRGRASRAAEAGIRENSTIGCDVNASR